MHRRHQHLVIAALILGWLCGTFSETAMARAIGATGVSLTPAHFPHQTDDDIEDMYTKAKTLGRAAVLQYNWSDPNIDQVLTSMLQLARQYNLVTIIELDLLKPGGFELAPPSGVARGKKSTHEIADAYAASVRRIAEQKPDYFAVSADINRLLASGLDHYAEYAQLYKKIYKVVKMISPQTKVFVTFNWDIFVKAAEENHVAVESLRNLVDIFRPEIDVLAISSAPYDRFSKPSEIPTGYYRGIAKFSASEPLLLQVGWPQPPGGEGDQVAFIDRLPNLVGGLAPAFLIWPILHDLALAPTPIANLGLYLASGAAKPAAARFGALSNNVERSADPAAGAAFAISPVSEPSRRDKSDKFAIYISNLLGASPKLLLSDPRREINHARVSPDHTRFVFTRYNEINRDGVAEETTSPWQTEAVVCNIDGDGCESVVPPRPGIAAGNAYWTPDGKHLLYFTNDRSSHKPGINILDLSTHIAKPFVESEKIFLADPHMHGDKVVLAGTPPVAMKLSRLYLTDAAGRSLRRLTEPSIANMRSMDPPLGDVDPKLSPGGRHVAFMRHLDKDDFAVFVVDVETGVEHNLSGPRPVDAVPEWSGDGKLLIFWHVGRGGVEQTGLYTMRPDGADRRRIPLPDGYLYTMPAFFPGSGSDGESRIIYTSRSVPQLRQTLQ